MNKVVVENLVVSPFATNCYLIRFDDSPNCVIIDPGGDAEVIFYNLKNNNLTPIGILLTHGHIDHIMALDEMITKYPIKTYAHIDEKQILDNAILQGKMFGLPEISIPNISNWIQENDTINMDQLSFNVIHTPGHSPGGCCYQLDSHIFVGDTLFESSIGRTDLPGGNYEQLIQSIKTKLFSLPDKFIVYPGHGDKTTIGHEKKFNPFLRGEN